MAKVQPASIRRRAGDIRERDATARAHLPDSDKRAEVAAFRDSRRGQCRNRRSAEESDGRTAWFCFRSARSGPPGDRSEAPNSKVPPALLAMRFYRAL